MTGVMREGWVPAEVGVHWHYDGPHGTGSVSSMRHGDATGYAGWANRHRVDGVHPSLEDAMTAVEEALGAMWCPVHERDDECCGESPLCPPAGWVSAPGGKWHRATRTRPTFTRDEATACGLSFRPLNVTWYGEHPPTSGRWLCARPGCAR